MPAIATFKVPATARASFGLYNTLDEIDALADGVVYARDLFR
jgi:cysteine desulfurase/selenocysteine lyase